MDFIKEQIVEKYLQRAKQCSNPTAKKLFTLMAEKQSNLALSLDVTESRKLLEIADAVGPEICMLKTHIDIVEDFTDELITKLKQLADKHRFILFEDRKFADIGNTTKLQYEKGIYRIAEWAQITNAHILTGPDIITGLKQVGLPRGNGLFLLAQISSQGNYFTDEYTRAAVQLAEQNSDFVIGFITQKKLTDNPIFIHATPGIHIASKGDNLGQQYTTPEQAIVERGNDIIIVGRGIYAANDPLQAAKIYREAGWNAYQKRSEIN